MVPTIYCESCFFLLNEGLFKVVFEAEFRNEKMTLTREYMYDVYRLTKLNANRSKKILQDKIIH